MKQRKPGCICELNPETNNPLVDNYAMCPVHKPDAPDPKKVANYLVNRFYSLRAYETMSDSGKRAAYNVSKESAVIATEEILSLIGALTLNEYIKELIPFYQRVKEEIQSL